MPLFFVGLIILFFKTKFIYTFKFISTTSIYGVSDQHVSFKENYFTGCLIQYFARA